MADSIQGTIDALLERASTDSALRDRLMADPRATIQEETGMTVPADWNLIATQDDGAVSLGFENDELPDEYLALVSGGAKDSCGAESGGPGSYN